MKRAGRKWITIILVALAGAGGTSQADDTAPETPSEIDLEFAACNKLKISWDGIADGGGYFASGLKEYRISRKPTPYSVKFVATTLGTPAPYNDRREFMTDVSSWEESTITISVNARDNAGNVSASTTASISKLTMPFFCFDTAPPLKPTMLLQPQAACTGPRLTASSVDSGTWASGIHRMHWFRNGQPLMAGSDQGADSMLDTYGALPGQTYYYQVAAEDNAGNVSSWSDAAVYTVPADCSVYADPDGTTVALFLAYFEDNAPPLLTADDAEALVFGNADNSNSNLKDYIDNISFGKTALVPSGMYEYIALPRSGEEYGCSRNSEGHWSGCTTQLITQDILDHHGVDRFIAERLIFIIGGYNYSSAGGKVVITGAQKSPDATIAALAHEFLHTLGMEHSGGKFGMGCWGYGSLSPHPHDPEFGCDGTIYQYGDRYSVMGSTANLYHPPIYLKQLAGWLESNETRLLTQDLDYERLYSNDERTNGLKQILLRRYVDGRPALYSIEYRMRRDYNGEKSEPTDEFRAPEGLYIRQILPFNLKGNNNSPSTLHVASLPFNSRRFFDPYLRFGIEWIPFGYGFDRSSVLVRTCGISNQCDSSWNDYAPILDD